MISRELIIEAYIFLRESNHAVPSETLDFIKDASLSAYDFLHDDYCLKCEHNGSQMTYMSNCTGCGSNGEKRHFKLKELEP